MTTIPEKPSDQLQEAIQRSRLICDIVEEELSMRWGPKPVKEMTNEEVLLQAVQICNGLVLFLLCRVRVFQQGILKYRIFQHGWNVAVYRGRGCSFLVN